MPVVPATIGHQHVVASGHELATFAAFEILENGGNALDAGVAAILSLGVLYSDQVSVAGVAPMMIHDAASAQTVTVDGVGGWPAALDVDGYIERHGGEIPLGVRRTVVPAAPSACLTALERWGTMRFSDVAARAAGYASEGFARHPVMIDYITQFADRYRNFPDNVSIWLADGAPPAVGSLLIQADLGRTLHYLIDQDRAAGDRLAGLEAVRHAFYEGDIASAILRQHRELDVILSAQELRAYQARVLPTVARTFRFNGEDVRIHSCGAWSQGPMMHEALSILDAVDLHGLGYGSDAYFHAIAEALKLTLADREAYLGDPDFVEVPLATLTSTAYGAERARLIDPTHASPGMPMPGRVEGVEPYLSPVVVRTEPERLPGDTSIVTVIDRHGNAFCATPSDTSWDLSLIHI